MTRFFGAALATALASALIGPARADDQDATATIDRAIKALGGEEKLGKTPAFSMKAKGTITFGGNDSSFNSQSTAQGLDRYRSEFEGEFGGNAVKGVTVLNGDKGWRKFNDNAMELDADAVANEKRNVYLTIAPITVVPLKGQGFKVGSASETKVGDKPAVAVKMTGPDGKDFTITFDKESGLPVKQTARVAGFGGEEYDQESTYADYKDFGGVKKATKVEVKRDGETFLKQEVTEFKLLDKVDASTFADPT